MHIFETKRYRVVSLTVSVVLVRVCVVLVLLINNTEIRVLQRPVTLAAIPKTYGLYNFTVERPGNKMTNSLVQGKV